MRTEEEREFESADEDAPASFSAVGIHLRDLKRIPMALTHRIWPWPQDSIYFFGRCAQAQRYAPQVFIEVFPLPEGDEKFQKEFTFYQEQKKGFLVEGCKFDPCLLFPRSVAAAFQRESFQTRDGVHRWRIVHVFKAPDRAVILVYSLNSAQFASNVFFRQVSESLEIGKERA
jgi:hypothetical protein